MTFKKLIKTILALLFLTVTIPSFAFKFPWEKQVPGSINTDYRWSVMGAYGRMTDQILLKVLTARYSLTKAHLYSIEGTYQLAPDNLIRRFFQPLLSTVEAGVNVTYQDDPNGSIYELNPFLMARWQHLPWDNYITTTFGFGEGFSLLSRLPYREIRNANKAKNDRKFLNLLLFEVTAALPSHPNYQLVYRIHHRSGVFGLYSPGIVGSTAVEVGFRVRFL